MNDPKLLMYKEMLASIAKDKGLVDLSDYIQAFIPVARETALSSMEKVEQHSALVSPPAIPKYNITKMPEAVCDGCQ